MLLSSSLTVSMMALLLRRSLSETDIKAPFMLFLSFVISCMPSTNSLLKSSLLIYPLSPTNLPQMNSGERLVFQRPPVVHVAGSNHEVKQLPAFVAYQVELQAEEPSHGAFAPPGNAPESLVDANPLVLAHTRRGAVHDADAGALAGQDLLDEQGKRYGNLLLRLWRGGCRRTDAAYTCTPYPKRSGSGTDTRNRGKVSV